MEKTCHTCEYAILHLPAFAECSKYINDKPLYEGSWCPKELTCSHWEQASKLTLNVNSFDWSNAKIIDVD